LVARYCRENPLRSSSGSDLPSAPTRRERRNHAVVYLTSFYKLLHAGNVRLRLPHPSARRIYRQVGLFVDYGSRPDTIPEILDFEQRWMWTEQNCVRLFFPREYPIDASLSAVPKPDILTPDPFYEEVITHAKGLSPDVCADPCMATLALGKQYCGPDLDQAKWALLNSLSSVNAQRGYRHAIDEFVEWYCSEPRLSFSRPLSSGMAFTWNHGIWHPAPSIFGSAWCAASRTRLPTAAC
jgi:hypothetical protein